MKKYIKENWLKLLTSFYSLIVGLMWLAYRVNYAGISKALSADKLALSETIHPTTFNAFIIMYLPVIFMVIAALAFIFSLINLFIIKKKWGTILSLSLSVLYTIIIVVVAILGSKDYMSVILPKFFRSLVISILIILFAFILFFNIEGPKVRVLITKISIMIIVVVSAIVIGYDLKSNYFTYEPVVYAVEDEYQIVFSTNDNSTVYIMLDGDNETKYTDLYAGSMKSEDLVHKITIKQSLVDNAKGYTVYADQLNYRGPFGAFYGKSISKHYNFNAPDSSDGINYYSVSDVHESVSAATNAALKALSATENYDSKLDFLVIGGDTCSDVEGEYLANMINKLAFNITKGEIPVIYARGNHECKGNYSEELYKYVGSKNQKFYYEFSLDSGNIKGLVLDLGEDHYQEDEGWWEYYGTDFFDEYISEQTVLLNEVKTKAIAGDYDSSYNMIVCHIPIVYVNTRGDHKAIKTLWTDIINNMNSSLTGKNIVDVCLYGHQHDLEPFIEGDTYRDGEEKNYLTHFNFRGYMIGRSANSQDGKGTSHGGSEYTGLLIGVDSSISYQKATWTNAKGEVVSVYNPWVENSEALESYGNELKK